jgi:hypothetical protein
VDDHAFDSLGRVSAPDPGPTRRALLLGGVAAAASGLVLPPGPAAARDGAPETGAGAARGGRRCRRRGKGCRPDSGPVFDVAFVVTSHVRAPNGRPYHSELYTHKGFPQVGIRLVEEGELFPGLDYFITPREEFGILWIGGRYYLDATNPLIGSPTGTAGYGGRLDPTWRWVDGVTTFLQQGMSPTERPIEDTRPAIIADNLYIHFVRRPDLFARKNFEVLIRKGGGA